MITENYKEISREFLGIVPAEDIFQSSSYSWGKQDKLCQVVNRNKIKVTQYLPWSSNARFVNLGELELQDFKGDVISGDSATFGYIIECDNGIVVFDSMMHNIWIEGEPVNWRVFPRSKFYENQLHIIYDDRLDIYSFNEDYLVDQSSKKVGLKYSDGSYRSGSTFASFN